MVKKRIITMKSITMMTIIKIITIITIVIIITIIMMEVMIIIIAITNIVRRVAQSAKKKKKKSEGNYKDQEVGIPHPRYITYKSLFNLFLHSLPLTLEFSSSSTKYRSRIPEHESPRIIDILDNYYAISQSLSLYSFYST